MKIQVVPLIAAFFLVPLLASCLGRTPAPTFYLLTPLDAAESTEPGPDEGLAVGIGPVTLPPHLQRPQIVTRASCAAADFCGELRVAELDRWAEPLEDNVVRVLSENLSVLLATEHVARYPWRPATQLDFQVSVEVLRFDVDDRGQSVLTARWKVFGGEKADVLIVRRSEYRETVATPPGYAAAVAAQSRSLARFSREIAGTLERLQRDQGR